MRLLAFWIFFTFNFWNCYCQNDTLVDKSKVLIGTTVLKGSNKNTDSCILKGYCLDKVVKKPCLKAMSEKPESTKVQSVSIVDGKMIVKLQIYENCAHDFLGEIEILDKNKLNVIFHEYGGFASCMCAFDVEYHIVINKEEVENFSKIEAILINGKPSTLTKIN